MEGKPFESFSRESFGLQLRQYPQDLYVADITISLAHLRREYTSKTCMPLPKLEINRNLLNLIGSNRATTQLVSSPITRS